MSLSCMTSSECLAKYYEMKSLYETQKVAFDQKEQEYKATITSLKLSLYEPTRHSTLQATLQAPEDLKEEELKTAPFDPKKWTGVKSRDYLQEACESGDLPLVKYLVEEKHMLDEDEDDLLDDLMSITCCESYQGGKCFLVWRYLFETWYKRTPEGDNNLFDLACRDANVHVIRYLASKGFVTEKTVATYTRYLESELGETCEQLEQRIDILRYIRHVLKPTIVPVMAIIVDDQPKDQKKPKEPKEPKAKKEPKQPKEPKAPKVKKAVMTEEEMQVFDLGEATIEELHAFTVPVLKKLCKLYGLKNYSKITTKEALIEFIHRAFNGAEEEVEEVEEEVEVAQPPPLELTELSE
jgi:hypothetical protein